MSGRNLKIIPPLSPLWAATLSTCSPAAFAKSSVTMLISNAKWMARANALAVRET